MYDVIHDGNSYVLGRIVRKYYQNVYTYYKWRTWIQPSLMSNESYGYINAYEDSDNAHPAWIVSWSGNIPPSSYWAFINSTANFNFWQWILPVKLKITNIAVTGSGNYMTMYNRLYGAIYTDSSKTQKICDVRQTSTTAYTEATILNFTTNLETDEIYFDIPASITINGTSYTNPSKVGMSRIAITAQYYSNTGTSADNDGYDITGKLEVSSSDDYDYYEDVFVKYNAII